jgi:hypothetical protein
MPWGSGKRISNFAGPTKHLDFRDQQGSGDFSDNKTI